MSGSDRQMIANARNNRARTREAADRVIPLAVAALDREDLTAAQRRAVQLRVDYPDDDLRTLAARAGVTKNAYWSRLRDAIKAVS